MSKITKEEVLKILERNNNRFATLLAEMGVSKLNLICLGNSISSGYSFSSFTKPLLLRNESIKNAMQAESIDLSRYHFARPEDNNDEHIYSWLINDVKLSEICKQNRFDIVNMKATGITETNIDVYYPLDDDTTIKGLLLDDKSINIIVYNGATGSFLDNVTRGGRHILTYGIKRDCMSIEATLKYIQEINRYKDKKIQVYLCGAPKLLGLSDAFINTRLKKISEKYANVTYVPNISRKLLYKKEDGGITPDLHYDEKEYLIFNNRIIETIIENYILSEVCIEIDKCLYEINSEYQKGNIDKSSIDLLAYDAFARIEEKYTNIIIEYRLDVKKLLTSIRTYFLSRRPYDFYYINKNSIPTIKELKKEMKK